MSEKKRENRSRRKVLKSLAAGGGAIAAGKSLPEQWARPVVDSVLLPGHAQTSGPFSYHYTENRFDFTNLDDPLAQRNLFARIVENMIPAASAQAAPPEIKIDVCIDYGYEDQPDKWRCAIRTTAVNVPGFSEGDLLQMYMVAGGTVGGPALTMMGRSCCGAPLPEEVTFQVTSADSVEAKCVLEYTDEGTVVEMLTVPIGTCPFGDPDDEVCPACGG